MARTRGLNADRACQQTTKTNYLEEPTRAFPQEVRDQITTKELNEMLLNELHAALLSSGKGRRTLSYAKEKPKPVPQPLLTNLFRPSSSRIEKFRKEERNQLQNGQIKHRLQAKRREREIGFNIQRDSQIEMVNHFPLTHPL